MFQSFRAAEIEAGESLEQAIAREWSEEVLASPLTLKDPFQAFQHVRGFYADDRGRILDLRPNLPAL